MHLLNRNKCELLYVYSFWARDIEFNSRDSNRTKSIFAYYIFYYIKNNLFQNLKVLFCIVIESLKIVE